VACFTENGFLIYQDHVVEGVYPRITFTGLNITFSGKFEADRDQIAGNYGSLQLRFFRSAGGRCGGIPLLTLKPFPRGRCDESERCV